MNIPFFYNTDLLAYGVKSPVGYTLESYPMSLVVGATGKGKTTAVFYMLALISKYMEKEGVRLRVFDYKNLDYAQFSGCKRHYGFADCLSGINSYHKEFSEILASGNKPNTPHVAMFDELGAFLSSLDKRQSEEVRSKLAEISFLGRGFRYFQILSLQRADSSENFKGGSRDQYSAILALGNLSKEQKQMLFSDYKDEITANCDVGQAHLLLDGKGIQRVTIPTLSPTGKKKAEEYIRKALS